MKLKQLSLLNILFLVTTVGALFALYSSQQRSRQIAAAHETVKAGMAAEIKALESELKAREAEGIKLREEFGFLTIGDRSKIHAIAVPYVQQQLTWTYRVYLPEGNDYFAACKINDLSIGSKQRNWDFQSPKLPPGEYLITASLFKDNDEYRYTFACKGARYSTSGSRIEDVQDKWPTKSDSFRSSGVAQTMTIGPRDVPLILLDGRSFMKANTPKVRDSTEGIILWIEMVPSEAANEQQ